jgi:hypothetical protein
MARLADEGAKPEVVDDQVGRLGFADEIARATRADLQRLGLDTDAAEPWAHGIVGMMQLVASWWLDHPGVPRERLVNQLTALLWDGFGHLHERGRS